MTLKEREPYPQKEPIDPSKYIPKILLEHKYDMEWLDSHELEFLKAEKEFSATMKAVAGWNGNFASSWLRRALWFREIIHPYYRIPVQIRSVPVWARSPDWYSCKGTDNSN